MKRLRKYKKASGDSINCSSHLTENLFQPNFGFPGNTNTGNTNAGNINAENINTGNACVQISHVTKCFGEELVLKEVNLTLNYGQVYGIVGNNGSGKTVLMKCICGFLPTITGRIYVCGKEIGKDVDFPESLGVIIETPGFLTQYTGQKNLKILADMRGTISAADIRLVLRRVGLDPDMKKTVGKYSLGMRQRLGIAQAIMEDPRLLILDEPFNGLDKHGVAQIRELLLELKAAGKTILLASHNEEDIRILCDHVYEMDGGVLRRV